MERMTSLGRGLATTPRPARVLAQRVRHVVCAALARDPLVLGHLAVVEEAVAALERVREAAEIVVRADDDTPGLGPHPNGVQRLREALALIPPPPAEEETLMTTETATPTALATREPQEIAYRGAPEGAWDR